MDQRTSDRIARRIRASIENRIRAEALDRVGHLDVEIIGGQSETRQEARLEHDTERLGGCLLRVEVPIAADEAVILSGRVRRDILADGKSLSKTARVGGRDRTTGARIGHTIQADDLRCEQFLDVRRPDRAVVGCAETDVLDRGEFDTELVRIGIELAAVRDLVARVAIPAVDAQVIDEVVVDQRN